MSTDEMWMDVTRLLDAARAANRRGDPAAVEAALAAARAAHAEHARLDPYAALTEERFGRKPVFS